MIVSTGVDGMLDSVSEGDEQGVKLDRAIGDPQRRSGIMTTLGNMSAAAATILALKAFSSVLGSSSAAAAEPRAGYVQMAQAGTPKTMVDLINRVNAEAIVRPDKFAPFLQDLWYDSSAVSVAQQTWRAMLEAEKRLPPELGAHILWAMTSHSTDKERVFKDITNNPAERFDSIFWSRGITMENYPVIFATVLNRLADPDAYVERVNSFGPEITAQWFSLINAIGSKMPVQNKHLFGHLVMSTGSIMAYMYPEKLNKPLSVATVGDQTWRLLTLATASDFVVARFTYGLSEKDNRTFRMPSSRVIHEVLDPLGIRLPARAYGIASPAIGELQNNVNSWVEVMQVKVATQKIEQHIKELEKSIAQHNARIAELQILNDFLQRGLSISQRVERLLPRYVDTPTDAKVSNGLQQCFDDLRALVNDMNQASAKVKGDESYNVSKEFVSVMRVVLLAKWVKSSS